LNKCNGVGRTEKDGYSDHKAGGLQMPDFDHSGKPAVFKILKKQLG
jgi:hypothetical protein